MQQKFRSTQQFLQTNFPSAHAIYQRGSTSIKRAQEASAAGQLLVFERLSKEIQDQRGRLVQHIITPQWWLVSVANWNLQEQLEVDPASVDWQDHRELVIEAQRGVGAASATKYAAGELLEAEAGALLPAAEAALFGAAPCECSARGLDCSYSKPV